MTTLREAAQMALYALEDAGMPSYEIMQALRAALAAPPEELDLPKVRLWQFLRMIEGKEDFRGIPIMRTEWPTRGEALEQPEQRTGNCLLTGVCAAEGHRIQKAQREWQGLTDEQIREFEIWLDDEEEKRGWNPPADIVKYIEAKLREKNSG